jgi:hypothetical protein
VNEVLGDWRANEIIYKPLFKRFLDLIKSKIDFMSEGKAVYSTIFQIQARLENRMDYFGTRRWTDM